MSRPQATASLLDLARQIWQPFDAAQKRQCVGVPLISIAAGRKTPTDLPRGIARR